HRLGHRRRAGVDGGHRSDQCAPGARHRSGAETRGAAPAGRSVHGAGADGDLRFHRDRGRLGRCALSTAGEHRCVLVVDQQGALHAGHLDGHHEAVRVRVHHRDDRVPRGSAHHRRHRRRWQIDDRVGGRGFGGGDCRGLFRDPDFLRLVLLKMDTSPSHADVQQILDEAGAPVIVFDQVELAFDDKVVLRNVSFTLLKGHTKIILGASGSGKSTILKIITGLLRADAGVVWVNGARVDQLSELEMMPVRADLGMIFQEGALFDSLTVRENVGYKLYEESDLPLEQVDRRVEEVLGWIGMIDYIERMPSELSGGQRRRVAIARAMAFKPRILLYDEATTGLDPITATTVDEEIIKLRDLEHVSSIVVTHQLRDAFYVATKMAVRGPDGAVEIQQATPDKEREAEFIMIRDGLICFEGDADALRSSRDPYIQTFLS